MTCIIGATGRMKKRFQETFGSHARKTFNKFTSKDSCTWKITQNTESPAV
jgi:hypothetical protein